MAAEAEGGAVAGVGELGGLLVGAKGGVTGLGRGNWGGERRSYVFSIEDPVVVRVVGECALDAVDCAVDVGFGHRRDFDCHCCVACGGDEYDWVLVLLLTADVEDASPSPPSSMASLFHSPVRTSSARSSR